MIYLASTATKPCQVCTTPLKCTQGQKCCVPQHEPGLLCCKPATTHQPRPIRHAPCCCYVSCLSTSCAALVCALGLLECIIARTGACSAAANNLHINSTTSKAPRIDVTLTCLNTACVPELSLKPPTVSYTSTIAKPQSNDAQPAHATVFWGEVQ